MLAIGTRFWDAREGSKPDKIIQFVERAIELGDMVIVAINVAEDKSGALEALKAMNLPQLKAIAVKPWGFTFAMNALVFTADCEGQRLLFSLSPEIRISKEGVENLCSQMDDDTLVVGARLPGHEFSSGRTVMATGHTIPWNTCRVMNLRYYAITGFPLVGDASFDRTQAGVEELVADSLLQHHFSPEDRKIAVKLVEVTGIEWQTEFSNDPTRRLAHERKMRMKGQRPRTQLGLFPGVRTADVVHLSKEQAKVEMVDRGFKVA